MDKIECAKGLLLVGLHGSIDGALSSIPHKSGLKVSISVRLAGTLGGPISEVHLRRYIIPLLCFKWLVL